MIVTAIALNNVQRPLPGTCFSTATRIPGAFSHVSVCDLLDLGNQEQPLDSRSYSALMQCLSGITLRTTLMNRSVPSRKDMSYRVTETLQRNWKLQKHL